MYDLPIGAKVPHPLRSCQKGRSPLAQANLRLEERTSEDKTKALDTALSQVEWAFGKGLIILGKNASTGLAMFETIEPEAKLFVLAEQVDWAEKAFHDALARRDEAQIAYLRQPNILTRKAFEATKAAEAIAPITSSAFVCEAGSYWIPNSALCFQDMLGMKCSLVTVDETA
jgi:hypothetical protein